VRIPPRWFPWLILAALLIFFALGLALGFRPDHGASGDSVLEPTLRL
jgi:hypothetical protein